MNENPERQNTGQSRFSLQRLAQTKPPGPAEPKMPAQEPVREDLEDESVKKPPENLARRPVPVTRSVNPDTGPRDLKILTPPVALRQTNPLSTAAPANGARTTASRPTAARYDVAAPRVVPPERPPAAQRAAPEPGTPASLALPPGIQRGFPRPQLPPNGNGRAANQPQVVPQRPVPNQLGRESPDFEGDKPLEAESPLEGVARPLDESLIKTDLRPKSAPYLAEVLDRLASPPAQTAVLGVCDDGLPVLLDLNDPAPGAILVVSDDDVLRTRLLRTLLQTSAALNSPRSVQFLILSAHPDEWQTWMEGQEITRHCLGIERLPDRGGETDPQGSPDRWLIKLAGWADQRRSGTVTGPAVILLVDDLNAATALEYDARVNFDWLVKEGPAVRIWPVVGLRTNLAAELTRWVRLFKTRLLGPADDASVFDQVSGDAEARVQAAQFAVRVQDKWLKFRVPVLPDEV